MKIYLDELPKSCCGVDCPFNHSAVFCGAIKFLTSEEEYHKFQSSYEYHNLRLYLNQFPDDNKQRYPYCPLRLYKENSNEQD